MMYRLALIACMMAAPLIALALDRASPARAGTADAMVELRVLPGWRRADGRHMAALDFRLREGWKTYWRAPGDAGIPPRFDWTGSRNLRAVEVKWPIPQQTVTSGMRTIGYADRVILPLVLTPGAAGAPIRLRGEIEIGVCKDVCVPLFLDVAADLPGHGGAPDPAIVAALAARPQSAGEAGVGRVVCRVEPVAGGLRLTAEIDLPRVGAGELAVVETGNPGLWVTQAETRRSGARLTAVADLYHVEGQAFALDRSGLRLTVLGGGQAVDIRGCPAR